MNKFIGLLIVCFASNVYAQENKIAATSRDAAELVSIDKMPLPLPKGEAKKLQSAFLGKSADGFSDTEKSPEKINGFFLHLDTVKAELAIRTQVNALPQNKETHLREVYNNLSKLKLSFTAATFDRGALIAVTPAGTKINNAWTGVERFFRVGEAGVARLTEYDLAPTQGKFYMIKEAVNTRVSGKPAISKVFIDDDGRSIEEIVWVSGQKFHMLTFGPDLVSGSKLKAAAHISAFSLAQELR